MLGNMVMQSKKKPRFFWISAMAPLTSVILGSVLVYLTHAEKHGVQVVSTPILEVIFIFHIMQLDYQVTREIDRTKRAREKH